MKVLFYLIIEIATTYSSVREFYPGFSRHELESNVEKAKLWLFNDIYSESVFIKPTSLAFQKFQNTGCMTCVLKRVYL